MAFRSLEKLINLQDGYRRPFSLPEGHVLLIQSQGERYLIDRYCPHAGQALDSAALDQANITCPRHGLCFSLRTGLAQNTLRRSNDEPEAQGAACRNLRIHELVYEGNAIGIDL